LSIPTCKERIREISWCWKVGRDAERNRRLLAESDAIGRPKGFIAPWIFPTGITVVALAVRVEEHGGLQQARRRSLPVGQPLGTVE
jgi:hypothetical protein